jgi:Mrp family chromosome partitioning ATPase
MLEHDPRVVLDVCRRRPPVTSVAVSHVKGGVGKTTFTYGLALELAVRGRTVELVDRDRNKSR